MKKGWEMKKLGELCNIKTGKLTKLTSLESAITLIMAMKKNLNNIFNKKRENIRKY